MGEIAIKVEKGVKIVILGQKGKNKNALINIFTGILNPFPG